MKVSISLSSGFSFQGSDSTECIVPGHASTFQSRYRAASHFRRLLRFGVPLRGDRFNLVIERLLISGQARLTDAELNLGFNLVIERLLISGLKTFIKKRLRIPVSISLSSGFSFQVEKYGSQTVTFERDVSISLSSGFSFQDKSNQTPQVISLSFQSRYRAASHFRSVPAELLIRFG